VAVIQPGTVLLGKYTLEVLLGSGGYGEVYRATQLGPGGFARPVAIKLLRPSATVSEQAIQLFAREARVIASVQHRNIVQVHEFARDHGSYFLVIELVDGITARDLILAGHGQLPPWLGVAIGMMVSRGLQHAHDLLGEDGEPLGIVHRDVSPSNIMIDRQGEVKLSDFGLAKMSALHTDQFTEAGVIRGTPAYMSPEQREGLPITAASDVNSLAKVMYELCTGVRLTQPPGVSEGMLPPPAPPSRQVAGIPEELDELLLRALSYEPALRPTTRQLSRGLQAALAKMLSPAVIPALSEEIARWVERVLTEKGSPLSTQEQITEPFLRTSLDDSLEDRLTVPGRLERDDSAVPTDPRGTNEDGDSLGDSAPTDVRGGVRVAPPRGPTIALEPNPRAGRETRPAWSPPRGDPTIEAAAPRPRSALRVALLLFALALLALSPVVAVLLFQQPELPAGPDSGARHPDDAARRAEAGTIRAHAIADLGSRGERSPAADAARRDRPGLLSVRSRPTAVVYLDRRRVGTTPLERFRIAAGEHELRLVARGRGTSRQITIEAGVLLELGTIDLPRR
jgi:serine/threonine-protein kinase